MNITAFAYFIVLIFLIPSLAISVYALLIYKLISKVKSRARYFIPPLLALFLAILITLSTNFPVSFATMFGYLFMFVYATEVATGMITPIFAFESRTTEKQRSYIILAFSLVLAILFMRGFASVMGTPTPTMGLLGLIDYRDVLKFGKTVFHFVSAMLPYFEIVALSAVFYTLCYGLLTIANLGKDGNV